MARKTAETREKLRMRLIDIAERRITDAGLAALKARPLAAEAGCAVGAIYNVFDDLTGLVLAVNGRTFERMGRQIREEVSRHAGAPPVERLIAMAVAYTHFAAEHPRLWRTLFDVEMSSDGPVPQWYLEELAGLFAIIAEPLRELYPETDASGIDLLTRTLFSSVHGIVLLGNERRISGVPPSRIEAMISTLLRNATARAPEF